MYHNDDDDIFLRTSAIKCPFQSAALGIVKAWFDKFTNHLPMLSIARLFKQA
ncbi:MAG: hypothetical protein KBT40_06910 [bacterium]|nr:hypothetical protein [Candidatus Minthenecus merdequi]